MKHPVRLALVLAVVGLLVLAFLQAGRYLSSPGQAPKKADVVLALGGDNGDRIAVAARLYHQGYAPRVMLTGLENGSPTARHSYLNWRVQFLLDEAVPQEAVILELHAGNSWEEAVNTLALLKRRGWQRVLVVSDPPHLRRLHWAWSRVFADSGKEFVLIESEPTWWNPARWWSHDESGPFVVMEYIKLAYYNLKY